MSGLTDAEQQSVTMEAKLRDLGRRGRDAAGHVSVEGLRERILSARQVLTMLPTGSCPVLAYHDKAEPIDRSEVGSRRHLDLMHATKLSVGSARQ
jgi:hypothetical protein